MLGASVVRTRSRKAWSYFTNFITHFVWGFIRYCSSFLTSSNLKSAYLLKGCAYYVLNDGLDHSNELSSAYRTSKNDQE